MHTLPHATCSHCVRLNASKKDRRNVVLVFCCMEGLGCSLNTAHFSLLWQTNQCKACSEDSRFAHFGANRTCTDVPCKQLNSWNVVLRHISGYLGYFCEVLDDHLIIFFHIPMPPPNKIDSPRLVFWFHLSRFEKVVT